MYQVVPADKDGGYFIMNSKTGVAEQRVGPLWHAEQVADSLLAAYKSWRSQKGDAKAVVKDFLEKM
jgi:hypothetical protein